MRYILLLLLFIPLSSCKKGKADITLKGTVHDATFGTGLVNCTASIYAISPGGGNVELMSSVVSPDGSYGFTFPREKVEGYVLKFSKQGYFTVEASVSLDELSVEEDNVRNYQTTAKSWAAVHLVNDSPQPSDVLTVIKQQGKNNCPECCSKDEITYYGALDTTFYCINDGNTTYSFNYYVQGGPIGTKSGVTIAFDTTELLLNY